MKKIGITLSVSFFMMLGVNAQKIVDNQFNSWWTYSGNHKLSDKLGIHTLYSFRRNDFVTNWQQSLLRLGINYKLTDNATATLGYDYVVTFPYGAQPIAKTTTEQRSFEQLIIKNKVGVMKLKHRYKLEQRYVLGKSTKHRFRYRFIATVPLGKKEVTKLSFTVFDEIFINLKKDFNSQILNQNWIYAGVSYKVNPKLAVKLGYMNQYLIKGDNVHVESNQTLQVGLSYSLDFTKDK